MERTTVLDVSRAGLMLLGAALSAAVLGTVRLLPPLHLDAAGLGWIPLALLGALTVAAAFLVVACLIAGLRLGSLAALAAAGAAAAVAGGAIGQATGSEALVGALPFATVLLVAAAIADRAGTLVQGHGSRVAVAGALLLLAEVAVVAAIVPAGAELLLRLNPQLLILTALAAIAASAIGRAGFAPAGLAAALGVLAILLDRGSGLELVIGLATLIGVQLLGLRIIAERDAIESAGQDETHLPALAAHLDDAALHFDGRLQLCEWNVAAAALLGLDAGSRGMRLEDLLGISMTELPAHDDGSSSVTGVGGLEIRMHRSGDGLTVLVRDGRTDDADRLARELRGTLEELLAARRTIELQREELARSATVDPLTGVNSRGAILDRLRLEIAQARRYQHPVAVVLLDVDDFVAVNRRHGVTGGDALLREIALRMRLRVREADALGRAGSDGFLAILPHTDEDGAATFAGALRHRLRQRPILVGEELLSTTVSIGVAVMRPGEELDVDGLLARVTEALDSARRAGGDRIALDRLHGLARLEDRRPTDHPPTGPKAQDSGR